MKLKEICIFYRLVEDGIVHKMAFNKNGEIKCEKNNPSERRSGISINHNRGLVDIYQHKGNIFINDEDREYLNNLGFDENQQFKGVEVFCKDMKITFDGMYLCNIKIEKINDNIDSLNARIFLTGEGNCNYYFNDKESSFDYSNELEEKHIF